MKEVQWSDKLSVGVELIDEQHKMWIQHYNKFVKSIESNQGSIETLNTLSFLIDYTHFHFSTEEKSMVEHFYPELEKHKKKHAEFRVTLNNLEEDFKEEGITPSLADSIDTLLAFWLIKHISEIDVEFGAFIKSKGIEMTE